MLFLLLGLALGSSVERVGAGFHVVMLDAGNPRSSSSR
jgi:hypothetical protein